MERLTYWHIPAAVALALLQSGGARAQLMIQTRCDASQSHCVMLVGPPGGAGTVSIPVTVDNQGRPSIGTEPQQLNCTSIDEQQMSPARPPIRRCRLWP